jgi:hypothetical protein
LLKRCKRLSEQFLCGGFELIPVHIKAFSYLKHLSIQSVFVELVDKQEEMKLFAQMFPLQGLQSLRIQFNIGDIHLDFFSVNFDCYYNYFLSSCVLGAI